MTEGSGAISESTSSPGRRHRKSGRLGPFRTLAFALHLAAVGAFCLLVIVSVVRSVIAMSPPKLSPTPTTLSYSDCLERAQVLWIDLENHRQMLSLHKPVTLAAQSWPEFRLAWIQRLRGLESECSRPTLDRKAINSVIEQLERVQNLYATHATQYAGEIGPAVDALNALLSAAPHSLTGR